MVIPAIVSQTDLAVLLPRRIAAKFAKAGRFKVAQPRWGLPDFGVCLHWSARVQNDPANRWLRDLAIGLFREPAAAAATAAKAKR